VVYSPDRLGGRLPHPPAPRRAAPRIPQSRSSRFSFSQHAGETLGNAPFKIGNLNQVSHTEFREATPGPAREGPGSRLQSVTTPPPQAAGHDLEVAFRPRDGQSRCGFESLREEVIKLGIVRKQHWNLGW